MLKSIGFSALLRTPLILFTLGLALRLLSTVWPQSLTLDEQITLYFSQINLSETLARDNAPPLFSLLLRFWQQIVPHTEVALRLLPFLISSLTLVYIFRRWQSNWTRMLFVLNPASISFASELKNSSLFEFFSVLFIGEGLRLLAKIKKQEVIKTIDITYVVLISVGLSTTHYLGLVLIFSGLIVLGFEKVISIRLRYLVIAITVLIGLTMLFVHHYLIHGHALEWMQKIQSEDSILILTQLLYVLGSYSRTWTVLLLGLITYQAYRKKTIESMWFLILMSIYIGVELLTDRSLGFRRFLIPLEVLSVLSISYYLPTEWKKKKWIGVIIIWGLLIQAKKIVEDIPESKSSWKQAGQLYCGKSQHDPNEIGVFAHQGQQFYFPKECARILKTCPETVSSTAIWLVQKQMEPELQSYYKSCFNKSQLVLKNVIGEESIEPILVFGTPVHE